MPAPFIVLWEDYMPKQTSFKTRVKDIAIQYSKDYYDYYVCNDYLIISDTFSHSPYYIISAEEDNYLHLIGVSTNLSASNFFDKCLDGTLTENDFEISSNTQNEKSIKGSIRRKISALPHITNLLNTSSLVEENFQKNNIHCTIASSDGSCTLGFIATPKARPKTLLKGNELDVSKSKPIRLVLSKQRGTQKFSIIESGTLSELYSNLNIISNLVGDEILNI